MMMNGMRCWSTRTLVVLACCIALSVFEAKAAPVDPENRVMVLLSTCGDLISVDLKSGEKISLEKISEAFSKFQTRMGIEVTGILDTETLRLINMPGCGVTEIVGSNHRSRSKRNPLPNGGFGFGLGFGQGGGVGAGQGGSQGGSGRGEGRGNGAFGLGLGFGWGPGGSG